MQKKRHGVERKAQVMAGEGGTVTTQEAQAIAHRDLLGSTLGIDLQAFARRVAHGEPDQQTHHDTGQADNEERQLPGLHRAEKGDLDGVHVLEQGDHIAAHQEGQAATDERADRVDAHGAAEFLLGEHVAEHRVGRGRQGRFANADANAREEHVQEVLAQAAGCGRQAPEHHADGDDLRPAEAVGQIGDGHAHEGVEQRKSQPVQQAELGVADLQVGLDRFDHQRQDLPIHKRKDVGDHAQGHHVPLVNVGFLALQDRVIDLYIH